MILVLEDDGCVHVYSSTHDVEKHIEALDADVIQKVFDDQAREYRIDWIKPNRIGRGILGWFRNATNGQYRLIETGTRDAKGLLKILAEARGISPESYTSLVIELEHKLRTASEG
jgi:hypothetical protein